MERDIQLAAALARVVLDTDVPTYDQILVYVPVARLLRDHARTDPHFLLLGTYAGKSD